MGISGQATWSKEPAVPGGNCRATTVSEKGGAMPSRTDVMVWGMVVVLMCMIAIDIVRTQV
jgi:hypothetical protein